MKKVNLDENKCIGCGMCCSVASENFTYNDEGRASLISENITEAAIEMSEMCPVNAISIVETECNCGCNHECNCGDNCNCTKENNCSENCTCNN